MITLDPFLNEWDERFHALVAKNMILYPIKPMLRVMPVMEYHFQDWCCNHIWLHKQPLFLWQMAVSMSIFGTNEIAMRLPSALMGSLIIFPIFRTGQILFNQQIAFFAALLSVYPYYQLELISGAIGMDHNDIAFMFYVTMSIWSFFEYSKTQKTKWIILIGCFAGCSILCKWLTGMLVYSGWAVWILMQENPKTKLYKHYITSIILTLLTFLPWQIYIYLAFPLESEYERQYNTKHVWEIVENHGGSWYYYLQNMNFYYGYGTWMFLIFGFMIYITSISENKPQKYSFITFIVIVYVFFSMIAKTKLPSYVYFISPLHFILLAVFVDFFKKKYYMIVVVIIISYNSFNIKEIIGFHINNETSSFLKFEHRSSKIHNSSIFREIDSIIPKNYTIFNCKSFEDIEAMFYSSRNIYQWYPNKIVFEDLKKKNIKMAFFQDHNNQILPDYIKNDTSVIIISKQFK